MNCGWCGKAEGFRPTPLPERWECPGCCWFRWPRPETAIQEVGPVPPIRVDHERGIFRGALDRIERWVPRGVLWDVGAGLGGLLGEAKARGWTVGGNETRPELVSPVHQSFGVTLALGDFIQTCSVVCDAITMHHGIEHLPWPQRALNHAYARLSPGGVLYLCHPDVTDFLAQGNTSVSPGAHNYEWTADQFFRGLNWTAWECLWHDRGGDSQHWLLKRR